VTGNHLLKLVTPSAGRDSPRRAPVGSFGAFPPLAVVWPVGSFGAFSTVAHRQTSGFARRVLSAAGVHDAVPKFGDWLRFAKNYRRPIPMARNEF
jgi:hypothetical protein